jgi:hypothetical protein
VGWPVVLTGVTGRGNAEAPGRAAGSAPSVPEAPVASGAAAVAPDGGRDGVRL